MKAKLSEEHLQKLIGSQLIGRPFPHSYADHTSPNSNKNKSMVTPALNDLGNELTSSM